MLLKVIQKMCAQNIEKYSKGLICGPKPYPAPKLSENKIAKQRVAFHEAVSFSGRY